jgi:double-stranded uracil-DNA glycosylase
MDAAPTPAADAPAPAPIDVVGPGVRLLFVGVNPSPRSSAVHAPFSHRSNRFWRALEVAGILDREIDTRNGLSDVDRADILARGVGITSLVRRATRRAADLPTSELVAGARDLDLRVAALQPTVVAVLGITAYRAAFRAPGSLPGRQSEGIGGAELWVVPNPSGLNAHATLQHIADSYAAAADAAGLIRFRPVPAP